MSVEESRIDQWGGHGQTGVMPALTTLVPLPMMTAASNTGDWQQQPGGTTGGVPAPGE